MGTHREEFEIFHRQNPVIYELFVKYACDAWMSGMRRYSAKAIIERIRWYWDVELSRTDRFKINNNHTAFYVRKLVDEQPYLFTKFFNQRERKSL